MTQLDTPRIACQARTWVARDWHTDLERPPNIGGPYNLIMWFVHTLSVWLPERAFACGGLSVTTGGSHLMEGDVWCACETCSFCVLFGSIQASSNLVLCRNINVGEIKPKVAFKRDQASHVLTDCLRCDLCSPQGQVRFAVEALEGLWIQASLIHGPEEFGLVNLQHGYRL